MYRYSKRNEQKFHSHTIAWPRPCCGIYTEKSCARCCRLSQFYYFDENLLFRRGKRSSFFFSPQMEHQRAIFHWTSNKKQKQSDMIACLNGTPLAHGQYWKIAWIANDTHDGTTSSKSKYDTVAAVAWKHNHNTLINECKRNALHTCVHNIRSDRHALPLIGIWIFTEFIL